MEKEEKKNSFKQPKVIAMISAFIGGLIIHLFALIIILQNHDNILVQGIGHGSGITNARWLLSIMGKVCELLGFGYNLAWLNGILFIALLAIGAYLLVDLFSIKDKKHAVLIGLAIVAFPTITSTLFYRFTVVYYGIAIVLAILSAYILIKFKKHKVLSFLIASFCIACSLGIYQAYFPLLASIFVLYLIKQVLENHKEWKETFLDGIFYCSAMLCGLIIYFIILKLILYITGMGLNEYQGLQTIGKIDFAQLPLLILNAYKQFFLMPIKSFCSLASMKLISISYIILGIISIVLIGITLIKKKIDIKNILLLVLLLVLFPIAVNLIFIMVPDGFIYELMVYSFVIVLIAPMILFEVMINDNEEDISKKELKIYKIFNLAIIIFTFIIVFCYAYQANVNYTSSYYACRQTENYFSSMITQIRMTEGFTDDNKRWMFTGMVNDALLKNRWQEFNKFGGVYTSEQLINTYSWMSWLEHYLGYTVPQVSEQERKEIEEEEVYKNMPCWPDQGSIKVVDDVIIIKFSEE